MGYVNDIYKIGLIALYGKIHRSALHSRNALGSEAQGPIIAKGGTSYAPPIGGPIGPGDPPILVVGVSPTGGETYPPWTI